jgi:hypothetical protein
VAATQAIAAAPPEQREGLRQKAADLHQQAAEADKSFASAQREAATLGTQAQQAIAKAEQSRAMAEQTAEKFDQSAQQTNALAATAKSQASDLAAAVSTTQQQLGKPGGQGLEGAIAAASGLTATAQRQLAATDTAAVATGQQLAAAKQAVTDEKAALGAVQTQHQTTDKAAAASLQSADEAEQAAIQQSIVAAEEAPGGLTEQVGKDLEAASHDWTASGFYNDIRNTLFEGQTASDFYAIAAAARTGRTTAEHADTIQALADARTDATRLALRDAYARPETNMQQKLETAIRTARTPEDKAAVEKVIQRLNDERLTKMTVADAQRAWAQPRI